MKANVVLDCTHEHTKKASCKLYIPKMADKIEKSNTLSKFNVVYPKNDLTGFSALESVHIKIFNDIWLDICRYILTNNQINIKGKARASY